MELYAITGFAWLLPEFGKLWADHVLRGRLLHLLEMTELEPSMMGASDHILAMGTK